MSRESVPFRQLWVAVAGTLVTHAFYTLPRALAFATSTAAPWAALVCAGLVWLLFWPVAAALARQPGKNLTDLALWAGGRPLAILLTLVVGGYFVISAGINVRQVSEMVVTALYPHTPQTFAMTSLVALGTLAASITPAGAVWVYNLTTWPMLISVVFVLVGNAGWGQLRRVSVKLQFEGEILSMPGRTDYTLPEYRRLLEQHIARHLEETAFQPMLRRVYGEWGADPVGFGQLFRSHFPTHDDWLAYRWRDHAKDAVVSVEIELFIRRFGLLLGNPTFQE